MSRLKLHLWIVLLAYVLVGALHIVQELDEPIGCTEIAFEPGPTLVDDCDEDSPCERPQQHHHHHGGHAHQHATCAACHVTIATPERALGDETPELEQTPSFLSLPGEGPTDVVLVAHRPRGPPRV